MEDPDSRAATGTPAGPVEVQVARRPPDVRTWCLVAILVLLVVHALRAASEVLMPLALALLASFALRPVVRALQQLRVPAPLGAALVVAALIGALGAGLVSLSGPAAKWLERAPHTLRQIEHKVRVLQGPMERVAEASEEVAELTSIERGEKVTVQGPGVASIVLGRMQSALITIVVSFAFLYFLLASGEAFAQRIVDTTSREGSRRRAQELMERVEQDVSRHLMTITAINATLGAVVACAMWLLSVPNPVLWGVIAGLLNFMPFVGAFVTALVLAVVSLISFDEPGRALLAPLVFLGLTGLEGFLITPALLGRRLTLRPVAVFIAVLLWSWLWGVPGAIMAVPLLAAFKIVCDQVGPLRRVGLVLGGDDPPPASGGEPLQEIPSGVEASPQASTTAQRARAEMAPALHG